MGGPSFGAQIACVVQFVVFMTLLGPIVGLCNTNGACIIPPSQYATYYGTNGVLNVTSGNFGSQIVSPLVAGANSSSGFNANVQQATSLGLIYGLLGSAWKSFTNFPVMIWIIFTSLGSSISFLPVAFGVVASIGILSYITVSDFMKVLSWIQKTDTENVGS